MKQNTFLIIFCILLVSYCQSYQLIIPHNAANDEKGYCYTKVHGIGSLERREAKQINGRCEKAVCNDSRSISIMGCGVVRGISGCIVTPGDLRNPYPECCFKNVCLG